MFLSCLTTSIRYNVLYAINTMNNLSESFQMNTHCSFFSAKNKSKPLRENRRQGILQNESCKADR